MNIEQAKQIPLEDFLRRLGYEPSRQGRDQLWYVSPLRDEDTPSFKVNRSRNAWFDFGLGKGGDIVDLVKQLERLGSVSEALVRIEELVGSVPAPTRSPRASVDHEPVPTLELTNIGPVQSKLLVGYMRARGIDPHRVQNYVQEAHYQRGGDRYFALAFANNSGGYELRNPNFKGTLGAKDITVFEGDPNLVLVFEGFFDFLSLVMLEGGKPDGTVIVLNSVAKREKAIETIRKLNPKIVELYRDHDPAGEQLVPFFRSGLPNAEVIDKSDLYRGYNDLNDWYANRELAKCIG